MQPKGTEKFLKESGGGGEEKVFIIMPINMKEW